MELNTVPDVHGLCLRDAVYLLENFGYRVRTVGRGKVISQSPQAKRSLDKGSTIIVTLG